MKEQEYVVLKEISRRIGLDRSNTRKWLLNQGFVFIQIRDRESRQAVNALTTEDAERAVDLRAQQGFFARESSSDSSVINDGTGFFYVIRLMPDIAPNRIKVGYAASLQSRIESHRCTCPQLELLKSWPCRKVYEHTAIAIAINGSAFSYGGEVYDVASVDDMIARLDSFFGMLPN